MKYTGRNERLQDNEIIIAPIKKRLVAFLIDWIIIILLYFLILLIFSLFNFNDWKINVVSLFHVEIESNIHSPFFNFLLKILFGLIPVIYFTFSLYFTKGRTVGKWLMKLRVVSLFHERLGLWHCFERSLGYFTSALESGFGFIQAIWNPNRMALHDKIGETIVISFSKKDTKSTR